MILSSQLYKDIRAINQGDEPLRILLPDWQLRVHTFGLHVVVVPVLVEDVVREREVRGVDGELIVWGRRRRGHLSTSRGGHCKSINFLL